MLFGTKLALKVSQGDFDMKKILFINPSLRLHSETKFLPVGVACVMTYLKNIGIDFDFLDIDIGDMEDDAVESFLENNRYDIILSGSIVTHYKWMKWLTWRVRNYNPNAKIIIGNSVAGSIPELFLKNSAADMAIMGEGEISTAELVLSIIRDEDFTEISGIAYKKLDGKVVVNPKRKGVKKLDDFPMIDWSIFDTEAYFKKSYARAFGLEGQEVRVMPVVTARGCAFRCTFCHFVFENDPYRYRAPENIILEIKVAKEVVFLYILQIIIITPLAV